MGFLMELTFCYQLGEDDVDQEVIRALRRVSAFAPIDSELMEGATTPARLAFEALAYHFSPRVTPEQYDALHTALSRLCLTSLDFAAALNRDKTVEARADQCYLATCAKQAMERAIENIEVRHHSKLQRVL